MTKLCDDEGSQNCPTAHVFIVSVARVPEEIKDEIKTLQDCGDLEPAYRDAASLRLHGPVGRARAPLRRKNMEALF